MLKLKNSGHPEKYRKEILNSILEAFEQMKCEDRAGTKPLYRSREWDSKNWKESKEYKKKNWYNQGNLKGKYQGIVYKSVLFEPATKGGVLVKAMRKREEELKRFSDERIKIIEEGGTKISNLLKNNPSVKVKKLKNVYYAYQTGGRIQNFHAE